VLVRWEDAFTHRDYHGSEAASEAEDACEMQSVGWMFKRTRMYLYLSSLHGPTCDETWRALSRIPIGCVREVVRIAGPA
jgi:hypothetical protein